MQIALGVSGGIAAYKAARSCAAWTGGCRGPGHPDRARDRVRHAAHATDAVAAQGARRAVRSRVRAHDPPHRSHPRDRSARGRAGHRERAGQAGPRGRRRPAVHVLPQRDRAGRRRPGDEHADVAPSGDAGQPARLCAARGVRVVDPESGWLAEGEVGGGAWPSRRGSSRRRSRRRAARACSPAARSSSPPGRRARRSIPCGSSPTARRARWATRSPPRPRDAARAWCSMSGPVDLPVPYGVERVCVETAAEMRAALLGAREGADAVFMAAAVADWIPERAPAKIKKTGAALVLRLERGAGHPGRARARPARACAGRIRRRDGRSARARAGEARAQGRWTSSWPTTCRAATSGSTPTHNEVTILGRDGESWEVGRASKAEIAEAILDRVLGAVPAVEPA